MPACPAPRCARRDRRRTARGHRAQLGREAPVPRHHALVPAGVDERVQRQPPQLVRQPRRVHGRAVGGHGGRRRVGERAERLLLEVARPALGYAELAEVPQRDVHRGVGALGVAAERPEAAVRERRPARVDRAHDVEHEALVAAVGRVGPLRVAEEGAVAAVRHHDQERPRAATGHEPVEVDAHVRRVEEQSRAAGAAVEEVQHRETSAARRGRRISWWEVDGVRAPLPQGLGVEALRSARRHAVRILRRLEALLFVIRMREEIAP